MRLALALLAALLAAPLLSQSTAKRKSGFPDPPKKDLPYLIHADNLLETEIAEAKEETRKDERLYAIPGPTSGVKTPLAGPEFLFHSDTITPDRLQLYRLESKAGRREVVLMRKKKPVAQPIRLSVFRIHENLYKVRVDESLAAGEYSLSPDGSNAVFCFTVE
jgi:hypothetical protein